MKKINNKGLSIVELIIVFAILLILIYGMMSVIVRLKERSTEIKFDKDLLEYKTLLTKTIYDDLMKNKLVSITNCNNNQSCTLNFTKNNETVSKTITLSSSDKTITYNGIVYEIPNATSIIIDETNLNISFSNNYLIIDIPYYENKYNATYNYGLYIAYPFGLE